MSVFRLLWVTQLRTEKIFINLLQNLLLNYLPVLMSKTLLCICRITVVCFGWNSTEIEINLYMYSIFIIMCKSKNALTQYSISHLIDMKNHNYNTQIQLLSIKTRKVEERYTLILFKTSTMLQLAILTKRGSYIKCFWHKNRCLPQYKTWLYEK